MTDHLAQIREEIARGNFTDARRLALCALDGQLDEGTRARLIHNLALCTHRAGDNLEALRILTENAPLFERINPLIRGNYHNELGGVFYNAGEIDRAVIEYRKAIEHYQQAGNEPFEAGTLNNISLALKDAGRYREALLYNKEACRILARAFDGRILADVVDSYSAIITAQAKGQGEHHTEQPINAREIASGPQSTRAP